MHQERPGVRFTARWRMAAGAVALGVVAACARPGAETAPAPGAARGTASGAPGGTTVRPGITVLLEDSIALIRGKRLGLLTNQTGIDEHGVSDIDLLRGGRAAAAGARLVVLFSPEHGIRGTEDRENIESGVDEASGLPVISLYQGTTVAPPDSILRTLDALVFDLQDIGTRTWTYVGAMVYAMRAAARTGTEIIVLDRPDPITGDHVDGPMLDSALANPEEPTPDRPGRAYALYPAPLRHGMTMGEMALMFNDRLGIGAKLHVIPADGWRRAMWFDETGLPWVRPSPNLPTLTSALVYPSLVAFEGTNVSVGRGTEIAFQQFGAPWMRADSVARLLAAQGIAGVRFEATTFTPRDPGDRKYGGETIPGVRIVVTDRDRLNVGRLGAAILWALHGTSPDSLRVTPLSFDLRFGSTAGREAIQSGADFDTVMDRELAEVLAFRRDVRPYLLYR